MENYSREIIDTLCDVYNDNEELVMDMLYYLYKTSNDEKMKNQIEDIFEDYHYCIECGNKMEENHYAEVHTELDERPVEYFTEWNCPFCEK